MNWVVTFASLEVEGIVPSALLSLRDKIPGCLGVDSTLHSWTVRVEVEAESADQATSVVTDRMLGLAIEVGLPTNGQLRRTAEGPASKRPSGDAAVTTREVMVSTRVQGTPLFPSANLQEDNR